MKQIKTITRKGSGRTKGSFSFVKIPLGDLNVKLTDLTTPVVVRRKWAEANGFVGLFLQPVDNSQDKVKTTAVAVDAAPVAVQVDNGSDVIVADKL